MPKFNVMLQRKLFAYGSVTVEAVNEEAAETKAIKLAIDKPPRDWDVSYKEAQRDDFEALEIEVQT